MLLAFPVETNNGLESEIYGNFGDATGFILFNNETEEHRYIENKHLCQKPNECDPMQAFGDEQVNVVILSGVGPEPLNKLQNAGIQVVRANIGNVYENVGFLRDGRLICLTNKLSCGDKSITCMCDCE
ncbi:MAG: hypothetical protein C0602_07515 [Denitrovibrio sp.]|nr:MAG: hypothetical protein C0602_07515 [Denitrovibrio sp.]